MVKVILVRHGETDWNKVKRIQGSASDTPLSEIGKRQAEEVALNLKTENIRAIYSSPLQRALHTAQAIAHYHPHLNVEPNPHLKEINVGALEGVLATELHSRFDEYLCLRDQNDKLIKLPEGESLCDVQKRAWDTLKGFLDTHSEGTIVVVTHYFVIMSIVCKVLNLPLAEIIHLKLDTGSISTFVMDCGVPRLLLFNYSCHSPG